jgi:hypothetical protein
MVKSLEAEHLRYAVVAAGEIAAIHGVTQMLGL